MLAERPVYRDPTEVELKVAELEHQVAHLEVAVTNHRRNGIATGLLAHRLGCSPDQAWEHLVRLSQATNVKLRLVAQVIVDVQARQLSDRDIDLAASLERLLAGPATASS